MFHLFEAGVFLSLCSICWAQSPSTSASLATSSPTAVTVTSISTLAIVILPSSNSSSTSPSTIPNVSASSSVTSSSISSIVLPTVPYTGQAILVGTCNIPQYTGLGLRDGSVIEVPLVGCSDDRPECCPSLSPPESGPSESSLTTSPASVTGLTATGIISKLNASPLSICPSDFIDIDPVCCPSGYSLYGQAILGNTPCYSMLSTIVPLPSSVSNSITSAVAVTASATATVSVIINQVFALGLPCAEESSKSGLSTGAKAGIGVGAGVGGLILIGLIVVIMVIIGKKRLKKRQQQQQAQTQAAGNAGYYPTPDKHMSTTTSTMSPYPGMGSPLGPASPQFQPQMPTYTFPTSPAFGGSKPSHASWASQPHMSQPPQYHAPPPPAAEMHAPMPVTHEIGDSERASHPTSPDMISSTGSNAPTSETSAYQAQQWRRE